MSAAPLRAARPVARLLAAAASTALIAATPAQAQEAPAEAGERTYAAADFERFAPSTAFDMLVQVPGFSIRSVSQERGLGEASGNVLLNGQRISNKSDDVVTQLRRVPAGNVIRIEIRDGAGLGIPGLTGQVANVVTRASTLSGQWSWRPEFRARYTDPLLTRFDVSVSGERGPVEYTVALENQGNHSGAGGDTLIYDRFGAVTETRLEYWTGKVYQPRLSGRFVIDGPGDATGNLNAAVRGLDYRFQEDGTRVGPGQPDRVRAVRDDQTGHDWEVGGDWEFAWGVGRLKLIGLERFETADYQSAVSVDWADGRPRTGDRLTQSTEESERVVRAEYGWAPGDADAELSLEAAFNSLDSTTRLFRLQPDGSEQEQIFTNGSARVEESRYEAMGTYGRPLTPTLSFQIGAGAEYSRLVQVGAGGLERDFFRPKGQANAVWQASSADRVTVRVQRRVGQLNFGDFLASANLNSGTSFSGNPNLVPPQSWELEGEWVHDSGAWGTSTLRVFGAVIEDIVDIVPIGTTGESIGNLDEAVRYGVEWRATTNLDALGWRGARLDTRVFLQRSQVEDPLTLQDREISGSQKRAFSVNLRHDVPDTDWAWGFGLSHQKNAQTYRLTETSRQWEIPIFGSLFVEHKDVLGLTVRASAANVFSGESYFTRTGYAGRRLDPISYVEIRDRTIGPIFNLEVRGRF